ncbi:MAG: hypothetical protein ACRYGG_15640 [Janthinobacterium lividum]
MEATPFEKGVEDRAVDDKLQAAAFVVELMNNNRVECDAILHSIMQSLVASAFEEGVRSGIVLGREMQNEDVRDMLGIHQKYKDTGKTLRAYWNRFVEDNRSQLGDMSKVIPLCARTED